MANTTFSGPVRSEGGFTSVSKNATTGAFTTLSSISSTGVTSFDANTLATEAGTGITTGSGTIIVVQCNVSVGLSLPVF